MLTPTYDNILVRVTYKPISSTIIIPDIAKKREDAFHGEVIAIGEDYPYELKKGDCVIFARNEGTPVEINEEELLILSRQRTLAKIKGE